jgi:hypothetical protein
VGSGFLKDRKESVGEGHFSQQHELRVRLRARQNSAASGIKLSGFAPLTLVNLD